MAVAGQGMEMLDGRREAWDFDMSGVIGGAGMGGLMGALSACTVPAAVSTAARVGFGALALSGSADAFARGDVFTGVFGLVTAAMPFMLGRKCFVAGTPIRTPGGSTPVERLVAGDLVLSRAEDDPEGEVRARRVTQAFVRSSPVLQVWAGGRKVGTTREHPFWVAGRGWVDAGLLVAGDGLVSAEGQVVPVDGVADAGRDEVVYNVEVEGDHTYFVGGDDWGFDLWAHNYEVKAGVPAGIPAFSSRVGTSGRLIWRTGNQTRHVDLVSGERNARAAGLAGARNLPGANPQNWHHVEFQALEVMRIHGIRNASLLMNHPSGVPCGYCAPRGSLSGMQSSLARGGNMTIFGLGNAPPGGPGNWFGIVTRINGTW